jgi:AcrR family transcriptional regulator
VSPGAGNRRRPDTVWSAGRTAPDGARPGHALARAPDPVWRAMASPTARPPLTRQQVVTAARSLIVDEGLDAVSFRRLAQRLGVTAPALYAYVSDKDDLLRSVTANEFNALISRFERLDGEDPITSLRRFSTIYVDYAVDHPALYKTMFQFPPWDADATRSTFGLPVTISQFAVPYQAVVDAIDAGLLAQDHPLTVALSLWTALHGLAEVLLLGIPAGKLRDRFATYVIDAALAGLTPRPG